MRLIQKPLTVTIAVDSNWIDIITSEMATWKVKLHWPIILNPNFLTILSWMIEWNVLILIVNYLNHC